jgi:hypothetical protein
MPAHLAAFNLLNDIDLDRTERRIAEHAKQNAKLIAANQEKAALEAMSQSERDEVERRAREERMRMVEEAQRLERSEEERVKAEVIEALVSVYEVFPGSTPSEWGRSVMPPNGIVSELSIVGRWALAREAFPCADSLLTTLMPCLDWSSARLPPSQKSY